MTGVLDAAELREMCLAAGADDVGFVALTTPGLEGEVDYVREALPSTRSLIAVCVRLARDNFRSRAASLVNTEIDTAIPVLDRIGHDISIGLQDRGFRAMYPSVTFPVEAHRLPSRGWTVSHKPVAVAAGLGHMGIHRCVIHPRFGSFIGLGTVLTDAEITPYSVPLDWNPCLGCNLCVAACPVGAIHTDGSFDFNSCYTHTYNQFVNNFADWVETMADSTDAADYGQRMSPGETTMQSRRQYRSGYCVAVCPAGEDVIGPYLADRKQHLQLVLRPLQRKRENVYVSAGSNAEAHVRKRFKDKSVRYVDTGIMPPDGIDAGPEPK
ncbi:4Fe-4S binding protein [Nocardia stercoris]|uniref:Epoxyqueuosine reductase n=1 Tax=Nocardia stercoris TaxID=2483361 RepID=A0A3M2L0T6_9NOCA|nr:4Fe-4S binding protein [Nocardia stercoris]RMI30113.1 epoxyqueuosine reductase [Nocardia stercoris]